MWLAAMANSCLHPLYSFSIRTFTARKPFSSIILSNCKIARLHVKSTLMEISEVKAEKKKIFVSGGTGKTGKRIVEQLLAMGFAVKAGVRDAEKAKTIFPDTNQDLQFVKADVTEGSEKLATAIGDDSDAVICATGFQYSWDLLAPWKVDYYGTVNLVEASRKVGVNRFILVSSILVNGTAMGQLLNPAYVFLNAFGLVLIAKLQAEQHIRKSGINYTIIRPGGLKNDPPNGNIVMEPEDTLSEGSISRDQVAEVAVESLLHPQSSYKVVEIVARTDAPKKSFEELFGSIKERNGNLSTILTDEGRTMFTYTFRVIIQPARKAVFYFTELFISFIARSYPKV